MSRIRWKKLVMLTLANVDKRVWSNSPKSVNWMSKQVENSMAAKEERDYPNG